MTKRGDSGEARRDSSVPTDSAPAFNTVGHPSFADGVPLASILERFELGPSFTPMLPCPSPTAFRIVPHPSAGHSSARIWRVLGSTGDEPKWCLRQWPLPEPTAERLLWIHHLLEQAAAECTFINLPVPLRVASSAASEASLRPPPTGTILSTSLFSPPRFCGEAGHLWQVEPWVNARNDFLSHPRPERLASVMSALAHLHQVWTGMGNVIEKSPLPTGIPRPPAMLGPSSGLRARWEQLEWWRTQGSQALAEIQKHVAAWEGPTADRSDWLDLTRRVQARWELETNAVCERLRLDLERPVALSPVLADIWSDHLFFDGDRLVKIIDYGGIRVDSVAADLARLLASTCGSDESRRVEALETYEKHRRLAANEHRLIESFTASGRLLGPLHWLKWIFLEQRFAPTRHLRTRIHALLEGHPF